ncbi:MAG TPA: hypothetical protein VGC95_01935, partial [Chitinophagaceae bacterium]
HDRERYNDNNTGYGYRSNDNGTTDGYRSNDYNGYDQRGGHDRDNYYRRDRRGDDRCVDDRDNVIYRSRYYNDAWDRHNFRKRNRVALRILIGQRF